MICRICLSVLKAICFIMDKKPFKSWQEDISIGYTNAFSCCVFMVMFLWKTITIFWCTDIYLLINMRNVQRARNHAFAFFFLFISTQSKTNYALWRIFLFKFDSLKFVFLDFASSFKASVQNKKLQPNLNRVNRSKICIVWSIGRVLI